MQWIGVDLDRTLAQYDKWEGPEHIGPPVERMINRVKHWLEHGHPNYGKVQIKLVTARVSDPNQRDVFLLAWSRWCAEHGLPTLPVTNEKDYEMLELWDDRVVQVEPNTGRRMDNLPDPFGPP